MTPEPAASVPAETPADRPDATPGAPEGRVGGRVTVRYWAGARAAAGASEDELEVDGPVSLTRVCALAAAARPGTRLAEVLAVCSALIGDRPAGSADPDTVLVSPGDRVEFLPPFAGG